MRRMVLAMAVLASGCMVESAKAPAYNINQAAAEPTVCRDEQPTGSSFTRRVCRTPEQRAADRAAIQSWGNRYPATPLTGDTTYPGVDARHPVFPPDEK